MNVVMMILGMCNCEELLILKIKKYYEILVRNLSNLERYRMYEEFKRDAQNQQELSLVLTAFTLH